MPDSAELDALLNLLPPKQTSAELDSLLSMLPPKVVPKASAPPEAKPFDMRDFAGNGGDPFNVPPTPDQIDEKRASDLRKKLGSGEEYAAAKRADAQYNFEFQKHYDNAGPVFMEQNAPGPFLKNGPYDNQLENGLKVPFAKNDSPAAVFNERLRRQYAHDKAMETLKAKEGFSQAKYAADFQNREAEYQASRYTPILSDIQNGIEGAYHSVVGAGTRFIAEPLGIAEKGQADYEVRYGHALAPPKGKGIPYLSQGIQGTTHALSLVAMSGGFGAPETAGATALSSLSSASGFIATGASDRYTQAIDAGKSKPAAAAYASVGGAIDGLTAMLFPAGKPITGDVLSRVVQNFQRTAPVLVAQSGLAKFNDAVSGMGSAEIGVDDFVHLAINTGLFSVAGAVLHSGGSKAEVLKEGRQAKIDQGMSRGEANAQTVEEVKQYEVIYKQNESLQAEAAAAGVMLPKDDLQGAFPKGGDPDAMKAGEAQIEPSAVQEPNPPTSPQGADPSLDARLRDWVKKGQIKPADQRPADNADGQVVSAPPLETTNIPPGRLVTIKIPSEPDFVYDPAHVSPREYETTPERPIDPIVIADAKARVRNAQVRIDIQKIIADGGDAKAIAEYLRNRARAGTPPDAAPSSDLPSDRPNEPLQPESPVRTPGKPPFEGSGDGPDGTISLKRRILDPKRVAQGMEPTADSTPQTEQGWHDEALRRLQADPQTFDKVLADLEAHAAAGQPRAMNPVEQALARFERAKLEKHREQVIREQVAAEQSGDAARVERAKSLDEASLDAMDHFDRYTAIGDQGASTAAGRDLRAIQGEIEKDLSVAQQERQERKARGRDLTPEEKSKILELTAKNEALQKQIDEAAAKDAQRQADEAVKAAHSEVAKEAKAEQEAEKPKIRTTKIKALSDKAIKIAREQRAAAIQRIRERSKSINAATGAENIPDAVIIGGSYLAEGVAEFTAWSEKVVGDVGEWVRPHLQDIWNAAKEQHGKAATLDKLQARLENKVVKDNFDLTQLFREIGKLGYKEGAQEREPMIDYIHEQTSDVTGFDREQTANMFSGLEQFKKLSQDPAAKKVRQNFGEQQALEKQRILREEKRIPGKTGVEREAPTDAKRRFDREFDEQLRDAIKRKEVTPAENPNALKTAQQSVETALRHRIADMEYDLKHPEDRKAPEAKTPITNDVIVKLRADLAETKARYDEIFWKPGESYEQQLAKVERAKAREERLARVDLADAKAGRWKENKLFGPKVGSAKVDAAQARIDAIRAEREHVKAMVEQHAERKAANKENSEHDQLTKRIEEIDRQINSGRIDAKEKRNPDETVSDTTKRLRAEREAGANTLRDRSNAAKRLTPDERAARVEDRKIEAAKKRITVLEEIAKTGKVPPKEQKPDEPVSATLQRLNTEREVLAKEIQHQADVAARKSPEQKAAERENREINKLVDDVRALDEKLARNDLSKDAKAKEPMSDTKRRLIAERDAILNTLHERREALKVRRTEEQVRAKARLAGIARSTEGMKSELAARQAGNYVKPEKKLPYINPEISAKILEQDGVRKELLQRRKVDALANRNWVERQADRLVKYARIDKLSSLAVFPKLIVAGVTRAATNAPYRAAGTPLKLIPGFAEKAPGELRWSGQGAIENVKGLASPRKVWEKLRHGETDIDRAKGVNNDPEMKSFVGNAHGAVKEPVRQGAYRRALQLHTEAAHEAGLNVHATAVKTSIIASSVADAMREIFMNDNFITKTLIRIPQRALENRDVRGARMLSKSIDFLMPIVNVPSNITIATARLNPAIGFGEAFIRLAHAAHKGELANRAEKLSPEDAAIISRAFKAGMIGTVLAAYAWTNEDKFGGEHGETRNKEQKLKAGEINIMGWISPGYLAHAPELQFLNMVASARRMYNSEYAKHGQVNAIANAMAFATMSPVKNMPFVDTWLRMFNNYQSPGQTVGAMSRDAVVPAAVKSTLNWADKERKPKSFTDEWKLVSPWRKELQPK